ncbi:MAG: type II toxin-antitoxin system VapC family toxin [Gammaproteobacteria bacterium]|nr:type II toxin-antitoxin system VapC family toxin [Gammaproteobacteria bacterium]
MGRSVDVRALLDTHALLWWLSDSHQMTNASREIVGNENNEIFVSAASAWEISTKIRIGRLAQVEFSLVDILHHVAMQGFLEMPISMEDAWSAGRLPGPHRDPFDRMLAAQALLRNLAFLSVDKVFDSFGVNRVW